MTRLLSWQILPLLAFPIIMIVGWIYLADVLGDFLYEKKASAAEIVFRKPLGYRVGFAIWSFGILEAVFAIACASKSWAPFSMLILCAPLSGAFLWLAGDDTLRFNLTDRIYSRTTGWPLLSKTRSSSMSSLYGVYVGILKTHSDARYVMGITGASLQRSYIKLGQFSQRHAAERLAAILAADLQLPQVRPPSHNRSLEPLSIEPVTPNPE